MKVDMVMVCDADGNEMYVGKHVGDCHRWCEDHNITGAKGEYIAYGKFDSETGCFEFEDYETI